MTDTLEETYFGVEAQRIYYDLRARTAAFELIREVVPMTYALHAGADAGRLIGESQARLEVCESVDEVVPQRSTVIAPLKNTAESSLTPPEIGCVALDGLR